MSRQSLVKAKSFYVMTEYILRRDRGFQDMRSSMSRHSVLCRDNGARRCITTRLDACMTETRCHNREGWARTIEAPCCDKLRTVVKNK